MARSPWIRFSPAYPHNAKPMLPARVRDALAVDRTAALWTMVLFFLASLAFIGLRRLTEDQSAAVTAGAQVGALLLILGVVLVVVRRLR
jgi:hypothetical protein